MQIQLYGTWYAQKFLVNNFLFPEIEVENVVAVKGSQAHVTCSLDDDKDVTSIMWMLEDEKLENGKNYTIKSSASNDLKKDSTMLSILNPLANKLYTCVFSFEDGTSVQATLKLHLLGRWCGQTLVQNSISALLLFFTSWPRLCLFNTSELLTF